MVTIALFMLLSCSSAFAASERSKLDTLCRMLYIDGHHYWLPVQLIKDGFLKEDESYDIAYGISGVTVNGNKLPEEVNIRYIAMLKRFHEKDLTGDGSMRGGPVNIDKTYELALKGEGFHYSLDRTTYQHLVNLMADEGIVKNSRIAVIQINMEGVTVNGQLLSGDVGSVYARHIKRLSGFTPKGPGDVFSIMIKRGE